MSQKIKINGRNARQMAEEISKIVGKSVHFNLYGWVLSFEMQDAAELAMVAEDAAKYHKSVGKKGLSEGAELIRSKVKELMISESYALSFAN
jgi:hypothetical protein